MATVFKELSSILVDGSEKSTPRQSLRDSVHRVRTQVEVLPRSLDAPKDARGSSMHLAPALQNDPLLVL
jgi:hypothetical protein